MSEHEEKYWDDRAREHFKYRGGLFYTVTAIPYYYQRRKLILKKINFLNIYAKNVCDFGCGDGEYIKYLSKENGNCLYHGVDISAEMIELARERNDSSKCTFEVSATGISDDSLSFDLIYSVAVYAHLTDEDMMLLVENIRKHCAGNYVLVEQVAPYMYEGKGYKRRTTDQYIDVLKQMGFEIVNVEVIDFWAHRLWFERGIGRLLISKYMQKNDIRDKQLAMIKLNSNMVYRFFSSLFTLISRPRVFKKNKWGYCYIVANAVKENTQNE